MRILFIDGTCPKPYSANTLLTEGTGGTEATVIRVASELGKTNHVTVSQHCRQAAEMNGNVMWFPGEDEPRRDWNAIVTLRDPRLAYLVAKQYPNAKHYLWCHDWPGTDMIQHGAALRRAGVQIVAVSDTHKQSIQTALLSGNDPFEIPRVHRVYNPLSNDAKPNGAEYDKNKLVFFSSPHKGLPRALELFQVARKANPDFKLYVSNPGYLPSADTSGIDGVVNLGVLTHAEILDHVRSALCVFYPNVVFPETFGLVLAEANAVGTPVICHRFGAASEVLAPNDWQAFDCRDQATALARLMLLYGQVGKDRRVVSGRSDFRLTEVVDAWKRLIGSP